MHCPKCGVDITETYESDDPSVGIVGGWYCDDCNLGIAEWEYPHEPLEDDVIPGPTRDPSQKLGTPLSELSGRIGTPGYAGFVRIAKSWGYD